MKKRTNKTESRQLVTEFIAKFAKALMGGKAKALSKTMAKDPELKDAFERYARESLRFQKHFEKNYGKVRDVDDMGKSLERAKRLANED